jgi:hypothetical protein
MSLNRPVFKLKSCVPVEKLDYSRLSENPNAFDYLMANSHLIDWPRFSSNPSDKVIDYLTSHPERIDIGWLCLNQNPRCLKLIEERLHLLSDSDWRMLCSEPHAIELLKAHPEKIDRYCRSYLSKNPAIFEEIGGQLRLREWIPVNRLDVNHLSSNPNAVQYLLENHFDRIFWWHFSSNPEAVDFLLQHPERIVWKGFSSNPNPKALEFMKKNKVEIDYMNLCKNPNPDSFELLMEKPDLINWEILSTHPGIFTLDYEAMRVNNEQLEMDLTVAIMHPKWVFKYPDFDFIEHMFGDD